MKHLNGAVLCVVDTETTGVDYERNEILEFCCLLLDVNNKPSKRMLPFHMLLKPTSIENLDLEALRIQKKSDPGFDFDGVVKSKQKLYDCVLKGHDPYWVAERFVEWFEKLKLAPNKRIMPIAHNYVFDKIFMEKWLGPKTFEMIFDPRYRCTQAMCLFENDKAEIRGEPCPFPKTNLAYVCSQLGVDQQFAHTALDDCVSTAEVYRKLLNRGGLEVAAH